LSRTRLSVRSMARPCPCMASRRGSLAPGPTHQEASPRPWYVEELLSVLSWCRKPGSRRAATFPCFVMPRPPLHPRPRQRARRRGPARTSQQLFQMVGPAQARLLHWCWSKPSRTPATPNRGLAGKVGCSGSAPPGLHCYPNPVWLSKPSLLLERCGLLLSHRVASAVLVCVAQLRQNQKCPPVKSAPVCAPEACSRALLISHPDPDPQTLGRTLSPG
jgi:hypothetical protein